MTNDTLPSRGFEGHRSHVFIPRHSDIRLDRMVEPETQIPPVIMIAKEGVYSHGHRFRDRTLFLGQ